MKNQWPVWLFFILLVVVVLFAINHQGADKTVPIGELFSEGENFENMPEIEYEFVQDESADATPTSSPQIEGRSVSAKIGKSLLVETPAATQPGVETTAVKSARSLDSASLSRIPFTIQVSSFKKKERAALALAAIKAAGHAAYMVETNLGAKGVWYRIYIGKFDTRVQADNFLTQLKQNKKYSDSFVISPK